MELILIGVAALLTSALTLFSGFGLGTILMPVFALFFPVPLAIAATAIVHFANNLFKLGLMAKQADWRGVGPLWLPPARARLGRVGARFSMPAAVAAMVGAGLLNLFDRLPVLANYTLGGSIFEVTVVKAVIGLVIVVFALLELWPRSERACSICSIACRCLPTTPSAARSSRSRSSRPLSASLSWCSHCWNSGRAFRRWHSRPAGCRSANT